MKKLLSVFLATPLIIGLASCGGSSNGLTYQPGDKVFTEKIIFDTSKEEPDNVNFKLGIAGEVLTIKSGREELEFGYKDKILTISGASLKKCGPGEKTLKVTYKEVETDKEKSKNIYSFNATKFITTPQEFQDINENLDGYYILMNDLDFSNFGNFEPLGRYTYEEDPNKKYFHGIFDGNGYSIKNLTASYSDGPVHSDSGYPSNYDVYSGSPKFKLEGHTTGNNVGVFQFIGSSGVVKNTVFDNVSIHGHTICGVIAGNVSGLVQDCLVKANCTVLGDSHFWDYDCNVGGAFGIIGGSGKVNNVVCLAKNTNIRPEYEDYNDDYIGEPSVDFDHGYDVNNNFWRFWSGNKVKEGTKEEYLDSNGLKTNGVYSVVGKCWGMCSNSVGAKFKITPYEGTARDACFGQTHLGGIKDSSGAENLGEFSHCNVYDDAELKSSNTYSGYDSLIWKITDGSYPDLYQNLIPTIIAE